MGIKHTVKYEYKDCDGYWKVGHVDIKISNHNGSIVIEQDCDKGKSHSKVFYKEGKIIKYEKYEGKLLVEDIVYKKGNVNNYFKKEYYKGKLIKEIHRRGCFSKELFFEGNKILERSYKNDRIEHGVQRVWIDGVVIKESFYLNGEYQKNKKNIKKNRRYL